MTVNNLSDHTSLNIVDQGITKLNSKIDDLQVARDIFIGMKALNDSNKIKAKIAPIAGIALGLVLATAAVATVVAFAVILSTPVVFTPALLGLVVAIGPAILTLLGSITMVGGSIAHLCKLHSKGKKGLPGDKLIKCFNTFKSEQKWDAQTAEANKKLCDTAVIEYRKCHNTGNVKLSELIKDLNEKIQKAEDDYTALSNQKLMSQSNIVPLDVHDYIANFTLALASR